MVGAMLGYSRFNVVLWLAQRWVMVDLRRWAERWPNGSVVGWANEQGTVGPTAACMIGCANGGPTVGLWLAQ